MALQPRMRGFSLVELLVVVAVLGLVLMLGLPNISAWLQNTQIRTGAEAAISGLQLARTEALRRNRVVRFSLVDTLGAGCSPAAGGPDWIVSQGDPTGSCDIAPSEDNFPYTVQKRSNQEGSPNVAMAAAGTAVMFSGLGAATFVGVPAGTSSFPIDFSNPGGGACQSAAGPMRCLRVVVSASGSVRMCDPAVTDTADPRAC